LISGRPSRNPEIAGERQFEPAAERVAVDEGEGGHLEAAEARHDALAVGGVATLLGQWAVHQFLDVGPGAERALAGACH
jgi:hypothetical protein